MSRKGFVAAFAFCLGLLMVTVTGQIRVNGLFPGAFVGQLTGGAGCTTIPYAFTGRLTTGVCSSAANTVDLFANNVDELSVNTTGATFAVPVITPANSTTIVPLTLTHGTLLTSATADAIENDGTAAYSTFSTTDGRGFSDSWRYFRLTASGSGISTIADFFGSNDGIPLLANGVYEIEWHCYFSQATAGTATWTVTTATTALATLTGEYVGSNIAGIGSVGAPQTAALNVTTSSAAVFPVTGTEATAVTHYFTVRAVVTAGAGASNTRLQLTMSAGTATPLINSYFRVRHLPAANTGAFVS